MNKICLCVRVCLFAIFACGLQPTTLRAQEHAFRKCYIIAYKSINGESQFSRTEQRTSLQKSMESLFNNQRPEETPDQHTRIDAGNYSDLFNPETDEILFLDFGIGRDKFDYNNRDSYPDLQDTAGIFSYFIENYFRLQNRYSTTKGSANAFLNDSFSKCRSNVTGNIAPSSVVFPLILTKIPQGINAEEYYLIMLSDYNDPTGKGQNEDVIRLDEAIHRPSRLILEKAFIKPMRDKINLHEIFQYGYKYCPDGNYGYNPIRNYVYIVGYKINCEDIEKPTVESNARIEQLRYGENLYKLGAVKLRFPHSSSLLINAVHEEIRSKSGNISNRETSANKENDF